MKEILIENFEKYSKIVDEYEEETKRKNFLDTEKAISILKSNKPIYKNPYSKYFHNKDGIIKEAQILLNNLKNKLNRENLDFESTDKVINNSNKFFKKILILNFINEYELENYLDIYKYMSVDDSKCFLLDLLKLSEYKMKNENSYDKKIRELEKENSELKIALNILENENENLNFEIEEIKSNADIQAKLEVFQEINSSQNDFLLDNFINNEITINKLKEREYLIPEELESIILTTKSFVKTIKRLGIKPKQKIGKVIKINLDQSNEFEYIGSEFIDSNDIKTVKIETSGWIYEDKIISKPRIREVIIND